MQVKRNGYTIKVFLLAGNLTAACINILTCTPKEMAVALHVSFSANHIFLLAKNCMHIVAR